MTTKKTKKPTRIEILGYSATSFLKWMGKKGYHLAEARAVLAKFATGELATSSIASALSDGRNKAYNGNAATPTASQIKRVVATCKRVSA